MSSDSGPLPQRSWRDVLVRVLTERSTPGRLACAVGVGALIGTLPLYGFHLVLCLGVATLLGLNRVVTYLAANISVPWMIPVLLFASAQLGNLVLRGEPVELSYAAFEALGTWEISRTVLLGSVVLGSGIGLLGGAITYAAVALYRRAHPLPPDPIEDAMAAVARAYQPHSRFAAGYARGKFAHDPVYRQLAQQGPHTAPLVDVGCGRGQTLCLLGALQPELQMVGIDWDQAKLDLAARACQGWPVRLERGDIRTHPLPPAGTLLLIDVLHYNPVEIQDAMLTRAAAALLPGGTLYVRDVDAAAGWRARVNMGQERLGCALAFNRGATLCFRPIAEIAAVLRAQGLEVSEERSVGDLVPLANVLLRARRPSGAADAQLRGAPGGS